MADDVYPLAVERQPAVECPTCGRGLFTLEDVSAITGEGVRTLQRRLEAGAVPEAIREQVPGGFRWLLPVEAVQGRLARIVPPLMEKVIPELEAVRTAEKRRIAAERRGNRTEVEVARHEADEAYFRAMRRSSEALDRFAELQGWQVNKESAPLIMALQRAGIEFRRTLYIQSSQERITAINSGIRHLNDAIERCRNYAEIG